MTQNKTANKKTKQNRQETADLQSNSGFGKGFWGTLITLLIIVGSIEMYGALTLHQDLKQSLSEDLDKTQAKQSTSKQNHETSEDISSMWRTRLINEAFQSVAQEYKAFNQNLRIQIKASFTQSRQKLDQRVDDWADWYFSVIGEYARLGHLGAQALGKSSLDEYMLEQLSERVFGPAEVFKDLQVLNQKIQSQYAEQHRAVISHLQSFLARQQAESQTEKEKKLVNSRFVYVKQLNHVSTLSPLALASKLGALGGVKMGLKYLGSRSAVKLVSSGLAKGGAKVAAGGLAKGGGKVLAGGAAKVGVKAGIKAGAHGSSLASGVSATVLCAPLGLIAPLCGVTAGVATWFAVDKAVVEIDEMLNRKEFMVQTQKELRKVIDALEAQTIKDLDHYEKQLLDMITDEQIQRRQAVPQNTRLVDQLVETIEQAPSFQGGSNANSIP